MDLKKVRYDGRLKEQALDRVQYRVTSGVEPFHPAASVGKLTIMKQHDTV
jgi:hypothetical protein